MPRVPPFDRPASCEDLLRLPGDPIAEIVDGELHANTRPAPWVASSVIVLAGMLQRSLAPDGWQILPEPELRLGADVLVPRLAGWRLARLPQLPAAGYFSVAPDWVCELVSVGTASLRARKMAIYAGEGVSHAWLIDPVTRTLDARRAEGGRWTSVATHVGARAARVEPFQESELELGALWPSASTDARTKRR